VSEFRLDLPIEAAEEGNVLDPVQPHGANDALFGQFDAPLVWRHVSSLMQVDRKFDQRKALHFAFERRTPEQVWETNWSLWYDAAIVTRDEVPADADLEATIALEEVTTGFGSDNNVHVRPWAGIVARMQDIRRYYFLCLEYPDAVTLYRREDDQWLVVARQQVQLDVWTPYTLRLGIRDSLFRASLDGRPLFTATDYGYCRGKAGLRASCTSFVTAFHIEAPPASGSAHARWLSREKDELEAARAGLPAPVLWKALDVSRLGTITGAEFAPWRGGWPLQCLLSLGGRTDGMTHALVDLNGQVLWQAAIPDMHMFIATAPRDDGHCDLFGLGKQHMTLVDGRSGQEILRRPLSALPVPPRKVMKFMPGDPVNLLGTGRDCFLIIEGTNERRIWAVDAGLSPLWTVEAISGLGHGNQVCACDIDGDGRDEVFGGACLFSADGKLLWQQEEVARRLKVPNAGHVDAAVMGFFGGPGDEPTVHMASSSAGHLVANARTGELLAAHPQGHVQGITAGAFVPGEQGIQVVSMNRWGNYGLTGVYAAAGRRLGRFQGDYECDAPWPVNWTADGRELILVAGEPRAVGLYDHVGRRVVDLSGLTPTSKRFILRGKHGTRTALRLTADPRDAVILRGQGLIHIIMAGGPPPESPRAYVPTRRFCASLPPR
jgi:hypothetical protein